MTRYKKEITKYAIKYGEATNAAFRKYTPPSRPFFRKAQKDFVKNLPAYIKRLNAELEHYDTIEEMLGDYHDCWLVMGR